eukprot:TRINITY_DN8434_c0_g1_i1.p1 TRINITY_DN8434_c0_g1~~TRINITY_DN8434_c0_g1_i1.p1  ORF type:complete len:136 (+),score=24.68 TRINITY_DN8434_c0_g1_i1:278-685(+)
MQARDILLRLMEVASDSDTIVICGDFNSMPSSLVYEFFRFGRIKKLEAGLEYYCGIEFKHSLNLRSAYEELGDPISNITVSFKGCLDYIWYTPGSLKLISVLENLKEGLHNDGGIPNQDHPSDHVELVANFQFIS